MRIVVKVGTSSLIEQAGVLNVKHVQNLCEVLSSLKSEGNEVILVSSGAIGMGLVKLGLKEKPQDIPTRQAVAAIGQCELMYCYDKIFADYGHMIAQILITGDDFSHKDRYLNFSNTIDRLLHLDILPIINENDTIATEEIKVGDNDTLSAYVAKGIDADLLVILSDIDGLYTGDPKTQKDARLISVVEKLTPEILALGKGAGSKFGTGGMKTKLEAAKILNDTNCNMVIMNSNDPFKIKDCVKNKSVGTLFKANKNVN